jgi:hypothetical protein
MKKIVSIFMVALMIFTVGVFAGCSGSKDVDLKSVLSDINSKYSSSTSGLTELDDVSDLNKYYQISTDDVKQFAAEITSDSSQAPIEIIMIEANDSDSASSVKSALDSRYQTIYSQYASYSAEQFEMVKNCEVTTNGNFVIMVVSEDYDGIMSVINEAIG